jgi:anti-sigma regulatory factor (Ser/Thr protein kinase)
MCDALLEELDTFQSGTVFDDITLLLLSRNTVMTHSSRTDSINCPVSLELRLKNDLAELQRLSAEAETFARTYAISDTETYNLLLVLEEVITNIISYGCSPAHSHQIIVSISLDNNNLTLVISDDARAFNPLDSPLPDLDAPLEDRPIGGLGIALFRNIMDTVEYRREHNHNILTLKRTLQEE